MAVNFVRNASVHSMEPIAQPRVHYPDHSVLLVLELHRDTHGGPIEASPQVGRHGPLQRLLALRPQELRSLAHQLLQAADSLDQDAVSRQSTSVRLF